MSKLVLFDWDDTIVNSGIPCQNDDNQLKNIIQAKVNEGYWIGLNSNTPLKRLQSWWAQLGMNGPIVAEKGAVIWWPNAQEIVVSQSSEFVFEILQELVLLFMKRTDIGLFFGDNAYFINSINRLDISNNILVALDAYRVCSIGMFVRKISDGYLIQDHETTNQIFRLISPVIPSNSLLSDLKLYSRMDFLSIMLLDADKTRGVQLLLEKWQRSTDVIMVGDSMEDYIDLPQVRHFAVGNAHNDFKKKAYKIAKSNYTRGCIEILSSV